MTDWTLKAELAAYIRENNDSSLRLAESSFEYDRIPGPAELGALEPGFSETVIRLVSERFRTQTAFCEQAGLSKQLFQKMKADPAYIPRKRTALACVIGLEMAPDEADSLLRRGSYSLSRSSITDVIVSFFLNKRIFDIRLINEALDEYGEEPLGSI